MFKKIIHIALLCLTTMAYSQVNHKVINTELSLGRLGSDCSGRGVCSFITSSNKALANTKASYNKDNTITLIIDRTKITKEEEYKIVGQYLTTTSKVSELTFVMEEDLQLEAETKTNLKTGSHLTRIAKGNYPVVITKDTFTIRLKLE